MHLLVDVLNVIGSADVRWSRLVIEERLVDMTGKRVR